MHLTCAMFSGRSTLDNLGWKLIVLDGIFLEKVGLEVSDIYAKTCAGVNISVLLIIINEMINQGKLPADACVGYLFYNLRYQCFSCFIGSEMFERVEFAPLLEF
jgi:hypothetical protein